MGKKSINRGVAPTKKFRINFKLLNLNISLQLVDLLLIIVFIFLAFQAYQYLH